MQYILPFFQLIIKAYYLIIMRKFFRFKSKYCIKRKEAAIISPMTTASLLYNVIYFILKTS